MKTARSVMVDCPANDVFAFLEDVSNETKWRQSIVGSRYLGIDLPVVGVDGETDVQMGSRTLTMRWTVTDLVPGEYVAWRLDGNPWDGGGSYRVIAHGDRAQVRASLEVRLKGAARALEPLVGLQFRRGLRADLDRLAEHLGADAGPPR